jgi:nucleolar protein 56
VAARLVNRAGGLQALARMSSATIQVLGAEIALFSHLRDGTPPPKHGIIYQHKRVHSAPRQIRGRVARVLASQLAIAARIDLGDGRADPVFLAKVLKHYLVDVDRLDRISEPALRRYQR